MGNNCWRFFCAAFQSNPELFHHSGFPVGTNGSVAVLGLLGACTVCRCNQRHSPWKMAVFLMCLFFDDELGARAGEEEPMEKLEPGERTLEYTLEGNGRMPVD